MGSSRVAVDGDESGAVEAPLLAVEDVVVRYGSAQVLHGVSLEVRDGEVVGILGSNGAGKTTLLHTISGLMRPASGSIRFRGENLAGREPAAIVRLGLSQVAEGRRIFRTQSVLANLQLGAYASSGSRQDVEGDLGRVLALFPVLREKAHVDAAFLSGGEQQMLAIGQAMMSRPSLLVMDEPSLGLAPVVIRDLISSLRVLRDSGMTLLVVEQQLALVEELCDRLYALRAGHLVIDGVPPDRLDADEIRAAYV